MQKYTGRRKVVTDFECVTAVNVRNAVSAVQGQHDKNSTEEEFLFDYMRGIQPIMRASKRSGRISSTTRL